MKPGRPFSFPERPCLLIIQENYKHEDKISLVMLFSETDTLLSAKENEDKRSFYFCNYLMLLGYMKPTALSLL